MSSYGPKMMPDSEGFCMRLYLESVDRVFGHRSPSFLSIGDCYSFTFIKAKWTRGKGSSIHVARTLLFGNDKFWQIEYSDCKAIHCASGLSQLYGIASNLRGVGYPVGPLLA